MRRVVWRRYLVDWTDVSFFAPAFLLLAATPLLLQQVGVHVPFWLAIPMTGVLFWWKSGLRWRDTASWTVPDGIALWLTAEFASASLWLPVSLGYTGLVVAMIFIEPLANRWVALVAPGHYTLLPAPDREVLGKLDLLDDDKEEFDDLDRRREEFVRAAQALIDRRSYRLGARSIG